MRMYIHFGIPLNIYFYLQASFAGIEDDEDEDMEIQTMAANYKKKGGKIAGQFWIIYSQNYKNTVVSWDF